jgi:DNA-binding HxlR family transcriptional regulator
MDSQLTLSDELRKLVEARMEHTLRGIEDTLRRILENKEASLKDLKATIQSLEESFNLLSQKWNLQILYTLFLKSTTGFGELKKILGVNSRTLSDKLKSLKQHGYIKRTVEQGPPLRVKYSLTTRGKNTVLLALPLLYYSSSLTLLQTPPEM